MKMVESRFDLVSFKGKTVKVMPVLRTGGWITNPEHEAAFLVGPATNNFSAPIDRNGSIICPLTDEEITFFESPELSGMSYKVGDLSPYKEDKNFWKNHKIKLGKTPRVLNLSNPKDYIDYKTLLANKDLIAPTAEEAKRKRTYKYMIVSEEFEVDNRISRQTKMQEAYMFFGKIADNKLELVNFLRIYGKKVPFDASEKWLKDEIGKLIDNDVDGFLKIARDNDKNIRLLIANAVDAGIVVKEGRKYFLQGGEPLANPGEVPVMEAAIQFLKANKNQDILMEIEARLTKAKD